VHKLTTQVENTCGPTSGLRTLLGEQRHKVEIMWTAYEQDSQMMSFPRVANPGPGSNSGAIPLSQRLNSQDIPHNLVLAS
jgi:hypothetical protein